MKNVIIEMRGISKVYDNGIVANENASIEVVEGEIHALAGENGAGKSTLMKILFGLEKPTGGEIFVRGEKVSISSPVDAAKYGIGMVHQHFMLVNELSVLDNVILGNETLKKGLLDRTAARKKLVELTEKYGMSVEPNKIVGDLSIVQKQKVEILKTLFRNCKILILDEPTAVLTPQETQEFFKQLILLRKNGYTIIMITHKLDEIKQICDRITIMRNGRFIAVKNVCDISEEEISRLMVGRDIIREVEKTIAKPKETVLFVKNVSKAYTKEKYALRDVSLECKSGEILCLCGVEGNGQRELINIITGFDKNYEGEVVLNGENIKKKKISKIRKLGLCHIPQDRMKLGVDVKTSIAENVISSNVSKVCDGVFLNKKKINLFAEKCRKDYGIKCDGVKQNVGMLSGGNIQKVVIARETSDRPLLLVADQPTRGVDVGAIEFIHNKLVQIRDSGTAVLLVSSDLSELFGLADRVLVFRQGKIVAEFSDVKALTYEELGLYMLGLRTMERMAE